MADTGFGISITFASGFFAEILSVDGPGLDRASVGTTHAGTTDGWATFIPSDIKDPGELEVEIAFDPDEEPPIDDAAETITVTYPNGATWACSGFMTGFRPSVPIDDRMTASCTLKWSGKPTFTPAA